MFRVRKLALLAVFAAAPFLASACGQTPESVAAPGTAAASDAAADDEASFAELQARGQFGMGVDQYSSTHLFDSLEDGGRIELQYGSDDAEAIATLRSHLSEIQEAFSQGDFSTPAFVHARGDVPGTAVMAARHDRIDYSFRELSRGGELRLVTSDPEALAAIHDFMAFQRDDHRAGGMDHRSMHHGTTPPDSMHHGSMHHGTMDHDSLHHGTMHHGQMDHGSMHHGQMDHGSMHHDRMDHGTMHPDSMTERHIMMGGGMMRGMMERRMEEGGPGPGGMHRDGAAHGHQSPPGGGTS